MDGFKFLHVFITCVLMMLILCVQSKEKFRNYIRAHMLVLLKR